MLSYRKVFLLYAHNSRADSAAHFRNESVTYRNEPPKRRLGISPRFVNSCNLRGEIASDAAASLGRNRIRGRCSRRGFFGKTATVGIMINPLKKIRHYHQSTTRSYPPREVQGFYKKDELELLIQRRDSRKKLRDTPINEAIVERYYQTRAIRRIGEAFEKDNDRKALIVMATGSKRVTKYGNTTRDATPNSPLSGRVCKLNPIPS